MSEVRLLLGDALDVLKEIESESVDAVVTDPPSGINFMNLEFDSNRGGRDEWIAWLSGIMREALRITKPGGHALVWALPRTSHWTGMALEMAGWEIRDSVHHLFSTGMPKSMSISHAIDKHFGAQRKVIGVGQSGRTRNVLNAADYPDSFGGEYEITAPATPEAAEWKGWGTNLAPAHEVWWLCRKPIAENTIAEQVLATGTGAIHIDACRIGTSGARNNGRNVDSPIYGDMGPIAATDYQKGRWPTNVVFSHNHGCVPRRVVRIRSSIAVKRAAGTPDLTGATYSGGKEYTQNYTSPGYGEADGMESVVEYDCVEDCPVKNLDQQGGISSTPAHLSGGQRSNVNGLVGLNKQIDVPCYDDSGPVSRFFPTPHPFRYQAKPSRREREAGCDHLPLKSAGEVTGGRKEGSTGLSNGRAGAGRTIGLRNHHPTLKSIELMSWLVRMITPPGGTVLDCFMGSGSTGLACVKEGFGFIGIEQDPEYHEIAQARIAHAQGHGIEELPLFKNLKSPEQASLFDAPPKESADA